MESLPPGTDPSKTPIAPNPNGDPANFIDPPSLAPAILGVGVTLITISAIFVTLRLTTNFKNCGKLRLDDYLCLFSEAGGIGYWAIVQSLGQEGFTGHTWDVPVSAISKSFIQRKFFQQIVIGLTVWASKAAILALYIRIFGSVRWLRLTSYALIVFMLLFSCSKIVVIAVYCIPRNGALWDATTVARCSRPTTLAIVSGVFWVVADLILFTLPFPIISTLQLGRRKRVGLLVVFSVGLLTIITSVVSLAYQVVLFRGNDPTWNSINIAIAKFAEVFGAVIVGCAPAMSAFWTTVFTQSKLYSSLRSGLLSRTSHSTDRKGKTTKYSAGEVPDDDTLLNSKHGPLYNMRDGVGGSGESQAKIYSSAEISIPLNDVSTEFPHRVQSSSRT